MKKTIAILTIAVLALSLVACGGGAAASASVVASAPASSSPASSSLTPASSAPDASSKSTSADGSTSVAAEDWGLTEAYMGMTNNNEAVCLGFNADWTLAVFIALSEDGKYESFVGPATDNEDGTATITDIEREMSLTFGVTELDSGNLALDMGDFGTAEVAACEVQELMDTLQQIDEVGTAVA